MMIRTCLLLLTLLSACQHRPTVFARSEYFNEKYLASYQVNTPDPCRACFNGQQIIVSWNVMSRCLPATIVLKVRYGNHETSSMSYEVDCPRGYRIYRLLNQEYWDREGIVSYSAKIYSGEECIGTWNHHLWAEIITLEPESASHSSPSPLP